MKNSKYGFTMIEMIFVIVVLGILSAIAIPKFAATRTDAQISKGRADIASIRSAIVTERQSRLIKGDPDWISALSQNPDLLFDGNGTSKLLMYGIASGTTNGHWSKGTGENYTYKVGNVEVLFTYDGDNDGDSTDGVFTCDTSNATYGDMCKNLIN